MPTKWQRNWRTQSPLQTNHSPRPRLTNAEAHDTTHSGASVSGNLGDAQLEMIANIKRTAGKGQGEISRPTRRQRERRSHREPPGGGSQVRLLIAPSTARSQVASRCDADLWRLISENAVSGQLPDCRRSGSWRTES